ncbi:MAG TPA: ATP phosphoribosyltransferase regulatory subunit, partial [Fimbriimonadaceae bacterium]|nr:ATP phosphoribosyltransferase regulatory subunit [Fimbriimonadaceae bacterium]
VCEVELFDMVGEMMLSIGAEPSTYAIRANDRILAEAAFMNWVGLDRDALRPVLRALDKWEKVDEATREAMLEENGLTPGQIDRVKAYAAMGLDEICEVAGPEAAGQSNLAKVIQDGLCQTPVKFDPLILRAFEYYTSTVFEVFDTSPTNRRSLFGGGRYDNLVSLFKKERIPGIGFGMGDVTLFDFLETHEILPAARVSPDVYVFGLDADSRVTAYRVARELQQAGFHVVRSLDDLNLPKHLKYASRVGARFVIMAGLSELAPGQVAVRNMAQSAQEILSVGEVQAHLAKA